MSPSLIAHQRIFHPPASWQTHSKNGIIFRALENTEEEGKKEFHRAEWPVQLGIMCEGVRRILHVGFLGNPGCVCVPCVNLPCLHQHLISVGFAYDLPALYRHQ